MSWNGLTLYAYPSCPLKFYNLLLQNSAVPFLRVFVRWWNSPLLQPVMDSTSKMFSLATGTVLNLDPNLPVEDLSKQHCIKMQEEISCDDNRRHLVKQGYPHTL